MDKQYKKGQRILIELKDNDLFEGDFYSQNKFQISVDNVREYHSGNTINTLYHFFAAEIKSVTIVKSDAPSEDFKHDVRSENAEANKIQIPSKEYRRLIEMSCKYTVLTQIDKQFYDAIKDISNRENVGVESKGANGRKVKMSFLIIATVERVYIFDIKKIGDAAFKYGLREILQSKYITKVIHDCSLLSECLAHKHEVMLDNVYDTQVADMMHRSQNKETNSGVLRTLTECLHNYFNIPPSLTSLDSIASEWHDRPLEVEYKQKIANNVVFLISLKNCLFKKMNELYFKGIDIFLNDLKNSTPLTAKKKLSSGQLPEAFEHLVLNDLGKQNTSE